MQTPLLGPGGRLRSHGRDDPPASACPTPASFAVDVRPSGGRIRAVYARWEDRRYLSPGGQKAAVGERVTRIGACRLGTISQSASSPATSVAGEGDQRSWWRGRGWTACISGWPKQPSSARSDRAQRVWPPPPPPDGGPPPPYASLRERTPTAGALGGATLSVRERTPTAGPGVVPLIHRHHGLNFAPRCSLPTAPTRTD